MTVREAEAGRVLVVEDDESTALFVTLVLKRHGFDASWVMDAEQATQRLANESFDVLLADCRLPGRSGVDLARETRRARPGIGIGIMTSYAETETESTARSNGADDFFRKPLHSSNLVSRIEALVVLSRAASSPSASDQSRHSEGHESESSPARGATAVAMPVEPALEAAPVGVAFGPEHVAESGPEKQAEPRDSGLAQYGTRWSGGHHRLEGASEPGQTRFSAQSGEVAPQGSGCGERQGGHLGGGSGLPDRDPPAGVPQPAHADARAANTSQPVLLWASAAPAVPITSTVGPVAALGTGPDWQVSD
ncbi:MAG: response regulator transcription factor [Acidimicrobiales bacterium]